MTIAACNGEPNRELGSDASVTTGGSGQSQGSGGALAAGGSNSLDTAACQATFDPTPAVPAPADLDVDTVARAATVLGSCIEDDGVDRNATHIWSAVNSATRTYFAYSVQLACLAGANCGCAGVELCLGYRVRSDAGSCQSSCVGSTFYACSDAFDLPEGWQMTLDCSKLGMECDQQAICVTETPTACNPDTYAKGCDSNGTPHFCDDGFVRGGPTCSSLGLDCVSGQCVGRGALCTNGTDPDLETVFFEGVSCAGDQLTACANGHQTTLDCTKAGPGFSCQTVGSSHFCGAANECVPADNHSASSSTPVTCSGTVLTFCNAGRIEHIDCTALGFTACTIDRSARLYGCH